MEVSQQFLVNGLNIFCSGIANSLILVNEKCKQKAQKPQNRFTVRHWLISTHPKIRVAHYDTLNINFEKIKVRARFYLNFATAEKVLKFSGSLFNLIQANGNFNLNYLC